MARKGPTRLKDVAEATGFSINTVSLALRGSPRVPETTSRIVASAAKKLNYLPNAIARSLAERRTRQIGIVVTDLMNPILGASAKRIEIELSKCGYRALIWGTNRSLESEIAALDLLRSHQVDGLIVYPADHRELAHLVRLRKAQQPVVLLAGRAPGIDTITSDDRAGARKATEHLVRVGHKTIAFLDSPAGREQPEKSSGYRDAMLAAGLAPSVLVASGFGPAEGRAAMNALCEKGLAATALLAVSDSLAIGVLRGCRDRGLRVPGHLALVGFDDIELAAFAEVGLTTVAYSAATVATQAVERMMALLDAGDRLPEPMLSIIEPELVVRDSTAARS